MRVVIQRVSKASVTIEHKIKGSINQGLLVLLGIENNDKTSADKGIEWLTNKIVNLRIFNDASGVMNKSILDIDGEILLVSQFTLHASTKKGNRPSYIKSAKPPISEKIYNEFCRVISEKLNKPIAKGIFGANMQISLINDGPVTIIIDTLNKE